MPQCSQTPPRGRCTTVVVVGRGVKIARCGLVASPDPVDARVVVDGGIGIEIGRVCVGAPQAQIKGSTRPLNLSVACGSVRHDASQESFKCALQNDVWSPSTLQDPV